MADVIGGVSDIEFREAVLRCNKGTNLLATTKATLFADVEQTVLNFRRDRPGAAVTHRATHNALRRLWRKAGHKTSDPVRLLIWVKKLPAAARARLDQRTRIVVPKFFNGMKADDGLVAWASAAKPNEIRAVLRVITTDGGVRVLGRRRSPTKRSKAKLEPLILGTVRGGRSHSSRRTRIEVEMIGAGGKRWAGSLLVQPRGGQAPTGGRTPHADQDWLVTMLAIDWHKAMEGALAATGRSYRPRFRELVFTIFDLLDMPGAASALRRHFANLRPNRKA